MKKRDFEQQHLDALIQDYVLVYDVDLYSDTAEVVKLARHSHVWKLPGMCPGCKFTYSEHISNFAKRFVASKRTEYEQMLSREYILNRMKDVSRYWFRFESVPNLAGNCHYEVQVVAANPDAFDGRVLIVSREIDDVIEMENARQKELDAEREYLDILTQDFTVVYHVNLEKNTSTLIKVDRRIEMYESTKGSLRCVNNYMERIERYCEKIVAPNLRTEFSQVMRPENIKKELKYAYRFIYRYRTVKQELERQFFEAQIFRMEEGEQFSNVLIGFRNIDDVVTAEQRHQIELEERYEQEQSQNEVLAALGHDYHAIFLIDLQNDTYERISCRDEVKMYYDKTETSANRALEHICEYAVADRFVERMRRFFDLKTLAKRLKNTDFTETECVIKDGNWHRARFIVKRRDEFGNAVSVLYITQVIDEEKQYQENLLSRVENADLANKAKTEFISQVAHDIRTPMNAIFGFLEIARANPEDAETVAYALEKMNLAGNFLKELIEDVLDIAKMESNKIQLQPDEISLKSFFEELYDGTVNERAGEKYQIIFETDFCHDVIVADRLRLKQVYSNILSNAVKYTPGGGTILLKASEEELPGEEKVRLLVEIKDNGIGMSKEFMEKMFNEYERAVDTRVNEVSGYGLGLSIVKRLVDLMGGTIEVKSKLQKGTTFMISMEVPYIKESAERTDETTAQEVQEAPEVDYEAVCQGMHLLIAEDNELNREVITELLKLHGISCECAEDGALCVKRFQETQEGTYDAILMDMQMPIMNGIEATRQIRMLSLPWAKTIPIIAMTANAMKDDIQNCLDAGMDAHLSKPVEMDKMLKFLAQIRLKK